MFILPILNALPPLLLGFNHWTLHPQSLNHLYLTRQPQAAGDQDDAERALFLGGRGREFVAVEDRHATQMAHGVATTSRLNREIVAQQLME